MLTVRNLSASIHEKTILHDISFHASPGTVTALLGPNGSGKSTLARALMGDPSLTVSAQELTLQSQDLRALRMDARARTGMFLSAQTPPAIPGVSVRDVLRTALHGRMDALTLKNTIDTTARMLQIPQSLCARGLNDGMSGGERKKMEVLQMALLQPSLVILDEIDTGVDVDALTTIGKFLADFFAQKNIIVLIITHHTRIFDFLPPQNVLVLRDGTVVARGDHTLADHIARDGFMQPLSL